MADQRLITLYPVDATPNDVVLRELPVADLAPSVTVVLYQVDATPKDVVLRDPTEIPTGGTTAYALTGNGRALTLTGQSATLAIGRALAGAGRALTLTGQDATLSVGYALAGEKGDLALTGQEATLTLGAPSVAHELTATVGALALTGYDATLTLGVAREMGWSAARKRKKDGEDSLVNSHHDDLWAAANALAPVLGTRTARQDAARQLVGAGASATATQTASNTAQTLSPQLAAMFALALDLLDE